MSDYICIGGKKIIIIERDWSGYKGDIAPRTEACPFCGGNHLHGGIDGHRVTHCGTDVPNPTVIATDGSVLSVSDGYWILDKNRP